MSDLERERHEDRRHALERLKIVCLTLFGLACVAGVVAMIFLLAQANIENSQKAKTIRLSKIEACKTITDMSARSLCIVTGGEAER